MIPDYALFCAPISNIPFLTTRAAPFDTSGSALVLADGSGIAYADEAGAVAKSDQALIELDDAPAGASDTPVAASATLISTFQLELIAIKFVVFVNWHVMREGAVSVVLDAAY
jgi:hypothetical protein